MFVNYLFFIVETVYGKTIYYNNGLNFIFTKPLILLIVTHDNGLVTCILGYSPNEKLVIVSCIVNAKLIFWFPIKVIGQQLEKHKT